MMALAQIGLFLLYLGIAIWYALRFFKENCNEDEAEAIACGLFGTIWPLSMAVSILLKGK